MQHGDATAPATTSGAAGEVPAPAGPAGRGGRLRRFAVHEWTLAAVAAVVLAVLMTWPALRHPAGTVSQDVGDPTLQAWQLAWTGHALLTDPLHLWQANASYPEPYTLAYSDSLLGYAPFGMVGSGPVAALVRYNVLYVLAFALAAFGAYALVRQLGAGRAGAAVAGAAYAYAPWRFAHTGHLNVLSSGGIALALAMLARGHGWTLTGGYDGSRVRPGWALVGWLVAAWQITLGFGLGVPFGYVLGAGALAAGIGWLVRRPAVPRRLFNADLAGLAVFVATVGLMAYPYERVLALHPDARRSVGWLELFSPPLRGFLVATADSWLWGGLQTAQRDSLSWPAEMTLLPGFSLIGLAVAGLFTSVWSPRRRLLLAGGVLLSVWFALGTAGPAHGRVGYLLLFDLLPGFDSSRTPGRLVLWTTLLLGVLAAGAVSALTGGRAGARTGPPRRWDTWAAVASVVPVLAVLAEGVHQVPHPVVPAAPAVLATVRDPVVVLPTDDISDMHVMLWSSAGFPRTVNGSSGYNPPWEAGFRKELETFPDAQSTADLRRMGVHSVVVLRDAVAGTPYQAALDAPVDGLGLSRRDLGYAVVYTVEPNG